MLVLLYKKLSCLHDGLGCPPSTGSSSSMTNFFSASNSAKLPSLCMLTSMSQPPMNSLLMYSCGMVGQSEYSLIPNSVCQSLNMSVKRPLHLPDLRSSSSSTLNAVNFDGSTPCNPKIWIDVLEKPHCGVSGVPFMKRTTGAEATALSIAVRTSCDRRRVCRRWCDILGWREEAVAEGRRAATAPRKACNVLANDEVRWNSMAHVQERIAISKALL